MAGWFAESQWMTSCTGVELLLGNDGLYSLRCCSISVKGNQLTIGDKKHETGRLEDLISKVPAGKPLALNLTGKGILIRQTDRLEAVSAANFQLVFPHTSADDFFIQHLSSGAHSWITLCRKEQADRVLNLFRDRGLQVMLVSLGPFAVSSVRRQFNHYSTQLLFDGHSLVYTENGDLENYSSKTEYCAPFPLKIDQEVLPEKQVLAYASAFQLAMYRQLDPVQAGIPGVGRELRQFSETKKFNFRAAVLATFFFCALSLNFLIYSRYQSKNQDLQYSANRDSATVDRTFSLDQSIKTKEKLLGDLGGSKSLRYAWICDQLGKSLPGTLTLDQLEINPMVSSGQDTREAGQVRAGMIVAGGNTQQTDGLNDWIYLLKEMKWIRTVDLQLFKPNEGGQTHHFKLVIHY